jgi:hypothetical protein
VYPLPETVTVPVGVTLEPVTNTNILRGEPEFKVVAAGVTVTDGARRLAVTTTDAVAAPAT